jgi:hypothetical protein
MSQTGVSRLDKMARIDGQTKDTTNKIDDFCSCMEGTKNTDRAKFTPLISEAV